jgi:hypothetical protein
MAVPTSSAATVSAPRLGHWRTRVGRRAELAAAGVVLLVAAVVGGNLLLSRTFAPGDAAAGYFGALDRGDAAGAWSRALVDETGSGKADARYTDRAALASTLAAARQQYSGLAVSNVRLDGDRATVQVGYRDGVSARVSSVELRRDNSHRFLGIYSTWLVVVRPRPIQVTLPAGASGVTLDGKPLGISAGAPATIAVWPLVHRVELQAGALVGGQVVPVDASQTGSGVLKSNFSPKLTAAGQTAATTALKAAFERCVASTEAAPSGCPMLGQAGTLGTVQWALVGDPAASAAIGFDESQQLIGTGHYQTIETYQLRNSGAWHRAVGGPFRTRLAIAGSNVSAGSLDVDTSVPRAARPQGATDQAALDLVRSAFTACAASTASITPDCPQGDYNPLDGISNVRWQLSGDPLAGAAVNFDGATSTFQVIGKFSMVMSYDLTGAHYTHSSSGSYRADLFWDGGKLVLVAVNGVL